TRLRATPGPPWWMVPKRHRPGRTGSVSTNSQSCWAAHRRRSRPPPRPPERSAISSAAPTTSATTATRNHTDEGMPTARSVDPIPPTARQQHVQPPPRVAQRPRVREFDTASPRVRHRESAFSHLPQVRIRPVELADSRENPAHTEEPPRPHEEDAGALPDCRPATTGRPPGGRGRRAGLPCR